MAELILNKRYLHNLSEVFIEEEKIKQVQELHACFNFISALPVDLEGRLPSLQVLSLGCNCLTEIPPLGGMVQLKELHLPNNQITVIERLQALSQLEVLNLRGNQISVLSNLMYNVSLKRLTLSGNTLTDIEFITLPATLPHLTFLGVYANQLQDISQVLQLVSLAPSLHELFIGCNPFCANQHLSPRSLLLSRHPHTDLLPSVLLLQAGQRLTPEDGDTFAGDDIALRHLLQILRSVTRLAPCLIKIDGENLYIKDPKWLP